MKVTILGARGSTSCVLVENGDQAIYLDAGTGMICTPDIGDKDISVLLTHPHLDHILGFPFFPYISQKDRKIDIYAGKCGELGAFEQLEALYKNPFWPCGLKDYPSDVEFHDITFPLGIGAFIMTGMPSVHPGGSIVYRLETDGRSVVYATDYEYEEDKVGELIEFSRDCDLLLFDAQYTDEEFEARRGFGHSTVAQGMFIKEKSGTKNIRFVHHDPRHTDDFLRMMESPIKSATAAFARKDEVIIL